MDLNDLQPTTGSFYLAQMKKSYELRPINMADELWLKEKFGGDNEIQKIFTEIDLYKIAQIAYHQITEHIPRALDEECHDFGCKKDFVLQKVKYIDEDGREVETVVGGAKLLMSAITGWKEKKEVLSALLKTLGVSRPKPVAEKKNKLDQKSPLIGEESLTSSATNMVGA